MKKSTKSSCFLAVILMVFMLGSCQSGQDKQTLTTANNETIKLSEGEQSTDLRSTDKFTMKKYERYFNSLPGYQMPLNKVFFGHKCTFYYGIPVDGNIPALYSAFLEKYGANKISADIQPDTSDARILAKDSLNYILVELIKTPAKNLLLGGIVGNDSTLMMKYYETRDLKTRIQNEQ